MTVKVKEGCNGDLHWLFFCYWDKTSRPKLIIEEIVYLALSFQRKDSIMAGRHGSKKQLRCLEQKVRTHIFKHK